MKANTIDPNKVRLGGTGIPSAPSTKDPGKVRLGGSALPAAV